MRGEKLVKEEIKSHWKAWTFCLSLAVTIIIIYKAIDSIAYIADFINGFMAVISPFLAGILMAYLLYTPENKIEQDLKKSKKRIIRKNRRKISILITYIIFILLIVILINVILPVILQSINELIANFQTYYTKFLETYNNLPEDDIFKTEVIQGILNGFQEVDLKQYINIESITGYLKGAVSFASRIFDVFIAFVVSIYILSERTEIIGFFKRFFGAILKKNLYEKLGKYFYDSNKVFFKFVSSQFLDAIVVGVMTTIAMKIIGVKYAALLGFTIGLFNMIPYFGAIIAVAISAIITLITGGFSQAAIMLIVVIILQQIDANVINPKITGDSLEISPLLVILSVTIGGEYFGIMGMFLAVPVAAVLKILVNDYIDNKA